MARRIEAQRRAGAGGLPGGMMPIIGAAIVALVVGLGIGYSMGFNADANPDNLFPSAKAMWVEMTADALALTGNQELARRRMNALKEEQTSLVKAKIAEARAKGDLALEQRLLQLEAAMAAEPLPVDPGVDPQVPVEPEGWGATLMWCGLITLLLVLIGGGGVAYTRMQQGGAGKKGSATRKSPGSSTRQSATKGAPAPRAESSGAPAQKTLAPTPQEGGAAVVDDDDEGDLAQLFMDTPVDADVQEDVRELDFAEAPAAPVRYSPALDEFMTRYSFGDDNYDMSFAIETPQTEFLGECGVGVGEPLNQGAPQQVTAFEVWLFDKDDIRTVTKVLLSDYAWNNDELRSKLAPKGELIHVKEGDTLDLETKSLRVRARIR
ncbi:MAG: hypothetical protein H0T73_05610, partial [Ardenticatenales bacterium]|nr:hypothetical protein [Ardenticatenales bacterium]